MRSDERRRTFRRLHADGLFVLPNAWDAGSARLLAWLGFPAVATTSSGHAATLGRVDQAVGRDELLAHVAELVAAVDLPVSVDAERCYADDPDGIAGTIDALAACGAAGCSIEDYDPATDRIDPLEVAAERVGAAAEAARKHGMVLTARAENHLYGHDDLGDTIRRLAAYHAAGAEVVYAPGLRALDRIGRVCAEVGAPVNVLLMAGMPPTSALAGAGVRRVSTGGSLAFVAYGALVDAARELRDAGTADYLDAVLDPGIRRAAFLSRDDGPAG